MDSKSVSIPKCECALSRWVGIRTLWLSACLLTPGLLAWEEPLAAQEETSGCTNGIVVEAPRDNPDLVADCEVLLGNHIAICSSTLKARSGLSEGNNQGNTHNNSLHNPNHWVFMIDLSPFPKFSSTPI